MNDLYLIEGQATGRTGWQAHIGAMREAGLQDCDIYECRMLWRKGKNLITEHERIFTGTQKVLMTSHIVQYPEKLYLGLGWGPDTPFIALVGRSQNEVKAKLIAGLFSLSECEHAKEFSNIILRLAPKEKNEFVCGFIGVVA